MAMAARWCCVALLVVALAAAGAGAEEVEWDPVIRMPGDKEPAAAWGGGEEDGGGGTRWAVLVAGSSGYGNYRHQVSAVSRPFTTSLPCAVRVWVR